ncbi:hypothetical protein Tco_0646007 [Tanacetum coccineum]
MEGMKVKPKKARKFKKVASPLRKLSPILEAEPVKKAKRVKRPAKKSTHASTAGVIIRDTPGVSISKKKAPAKGDKGKGMELLFDATLYEAAQVPDEFKDKTTRTDEGTGTKPGVPNVPTYESDSDNESWGDSEDESDDINDDDNDDDNANDDDSENEDDDGNDAHDSERTDSDDDDENPSFTLKDYDEEEHDEEYESNDDNENVYEEEDDDLYKDVDVRSLGAEYEKERKGDEEMTDADQNVSQEKSYEQVIEDAHVTLTTSQKTESSKQSSYVSSDFASKFLILDNVPPMVDEVASMMNVKNRQEESSTQAPSFFTVPETAIPETSTAHTTTVPLTISMITPLPQLMTPSPAPTTVPTTTLIPALPDFSSLFGFDQRVSTLIALQSYTKEFEKKAQEERKLYIDVSTYEASTSLTEFELKKILLDKIENSKLYQATPEHKELYDGLVKSYNLDKYLFSSYGNVYSLKRDREDKDKDKDPPAGSIQGLKKQKMSKDAEPPKGSKSKESKTSSSKGTKSQPKSSGKSMQAEDLRLQTPKCHKIKEKPERPPTPDPDWNATKSIDSRPPQKWISRIAQIEKHPLTFDELMSTPIDFSAYNNPDGHEYPFDLSKPLPLIEAQGHQVVPVDYFFKNNLEYLKGGSSSMKYTTFTTKTKAAKYDNIEGIEYMVPTLWSLVKLLLVQKKLSNLEKDVIFDLNFELRMFTRRIVILKRGLIRSDELYKFCDGTLTFVQRVLHDIASSLSMDYLTKRRWSNLDKKRSRKKIKAIDQQMFERRLMRNLEKFIGGREYGNDFRLLEWTI